MYVKNKDVKRVYFTCNGARHLLYCYCCYYLYQEGDEESDDEHFVDVDSSDSENEVKGDSAAATKGSKGWTHGSATKDGEFMFGY